MHMLKKNPTTRVPIKTDQWFLFKEAEKAEAVEQESDRTTRDRVAL